MIDIPTDYRRLTYAQIAAMWHISAKTARAIAARAGWPSYIGFDHKARVYVPRACLDRPQDMRQVSGRKGSDLKTYRARQKALRDEARADADAKRAADLKQAREDATARFFAESQRTPSETWHQLPLL